MTAATMRPMPNTKNASAAPIRTTRSGSRVPSSRPTPIGERIRGDHARRGPEPDPERIRAGRQGDRREHRLVADLGEEECDPDGEHDRTRRPIDARAFRLVELVATQGPDPETEERQAAQEAEDVGRDEQPDGLADRDRGEVDERGRRRDPDQDRQRPEPRGERQRHQLALVAELGHEDDGEAQEERFHVSPDRACGRDGRRYGIVVPARRWRPDAAWPRLTPLGPAIVSSVADTSPAPGRWAFRPIPPEPRSIVELIADGTLDAELSAQLWLLLEARVPIIVAAEAQHVGKTTLLSALLAFLPPDVAVGRAGR